MEKTNLSVHQPVKVVTTIPEAVGSEVEFTSVKEETKNRFPLTDEVSLARRLKELKRTDRSKLSTPDKISLLRERYIIQYQLDREKELIHVPFIITVIGIILLTLLL